MPASALARRSSNKAAALIIVLAFVVLLTGLSLAYFSRTTSERQLAHSSYNDTSADLLARTAMDIIVSDFKQEIVNGSTAASVNGTTVYTPLFPAYMVPERSGSSSLVPNLIRRSVANDQIPAPGVPSRASAVNSSTNVSANRRSVTPARWNSHYLVPKQNTATADSIPIDSFANATPDWVFVTDQGPTPSPSPANVVGRYAYAVYDEGGLLDANLVGLPSPTPGPVTIASPSPSRTAYISRRGTVAFADLTGLPLTTGGSTPAPMTISRVVGWRNYATTTVPTNQTFPDLSPSPSPFVTYFLDNSRDFLTVNPSPTSQGRTDQVFATRSELIRLVLSSIGTSPNLLQYLSTFSRELNGPTWQSTSNPIRQRFQLDNISLLGSSPTPSPSPGNAPAIKAAFGLQWSTTNSRWQYVGTQGTTVLSAIPTPAPGGSPAPDFFQILNYAYPGQTIDQILSLGASIIDQYDADQVTSAIIAALLTSALPYEPPPTTGIPSSSATAAATWIAAATSTQPAISRQDLARLAAAVGTTIGSTEEQKETVARALADTTQTRTWGLLIDVIAQSGRYAPGETDLRKFVVAGEQHYWVHVAIDRFTGWVIDKQIEVVNE